MEDSAFTKEQREELKGLIFEAVEAYFLKKGKTWQGYIITAATVLGSITVILASFKAMLLWIGFSYVTQKP